MCDLFLCAMILTIDFHSQVCRRLYDLISNSPELQYSMHLSVNGMVNGPSCDLSVTERIERLCDNRTAWRRVWCRSPVTVRLSNDCSAYEYVAGVFVKTQGLLHPGPQSLVACYMPTRTTSERQVLITDVGLPIKDFAVDPTQNLLALMHVSGTQILEDGDLIRDARVHVHLRTLVHEAKAHPEARCSDIEFKIPENGMRIPVTDSIEIVDDVVGVCFLEASTVLIWSWRTGQLLVVSASSLFFFCCDISVLISPAVPLP